MGASMRGTPNDKNDGRKASPCATLIFLLPPFATNLLRMITPNWRQSYKETDLHPFAATLAKDLSTGRATRFTFVSPQKNALTIAFSNVQTDGADLKAALALTINEAQVFSGSMQLRGILERGHVTIAHAVVGLTELLYDELMYAVAVSDSNVEARMGLMRLSGTLTNAELITGAVAPLYERRGRNPEPGFDYRLIYGFYPMLGFEHFYGGDFRIAE